MAVVNKQLARNPSGVAPTMNAASAGGDLIQYPGSDCFVLVRNGSGAPITCTITTPGTLSTGDAYPDKIVTVPAGADRIFPVGVEYANANNQAALAWSATATVTFAVLSVA